MKISIRITILLCMAVNYQLYSQQFRGDGIAIHKDSLIISAWASSATVERGYINIENPEQTATEAGVTSNRAFYGTVENVLGKANGRFLSLGDGGSVILQFDKPICNKQGADFAVFENAMFAPPNQTEKAFVELAFVEVSSDGVHYERFPAISNQQYASQIGTYEAVDWTLFRNLAGVYPVFYGYPFDLDDIEENEYVDKNNIRYVKIIDVVGSINPAFASYDSHGNIINDPFPTPFATCGFDLDAVGVIHQCGNVSCNVIKDDDYVIYPNPARDYINISFENLKNIQVFDVNGRQIFNIYTNSNECSINTNGLKAGTYVVVLMSDTKLYSKQIVVND